MRTFEQWNTLTGGSRELRALASSASSPTKARARGLRVLLTVTRRRAAMADARRSTRPSSTDLATLLLRRDVAYEVWNEPDENDLLAQRPAARRVRRAAQGRLRRDQDGDPTRKVLVGGLVGNDYEFLEELYVHGAKGSFDGVGVHTDTACLTTDPREYYREPSGRIGRYSFTGYREVRATMSPTATTSRSG